MTDTMVLVLPPRPALFDPEVPPPGFELKLISFWRDRPKITPRLQLIHTNWANREGSIEASWNWANAGGGNTIPHFQVDRDGRGAMLLPLDRKGIANYQAAYFSIGIETADRGLLVDPSPAGSYFTVEQAHSVAVALAYCAWGFGIPLDEPKTWDGSGTACHTEPFGYPYWTNSAAKRCPGERKIAQCHDVVVPRARLILNAWRHPTTTGDFLVGLTDEQQQDIYERVMGALPGPFSEAQRGPGAEGGHRRFVLDDQDGAHIVGLLGQLDERIARLEQA